MACSTDYARAEMLKMPVRVIWLISRILYYVLSADLPRKFLYCYPRVNEFFDFFTINSADLEAIFKHIPSNPHLPNGYRIIAADASKNNLVTTFDMVELRKLILGIYPDFLPNHEQPWRFIPEFVPQNFQVAFDMNPFALLGGAYLEQGWAYTLPADGQRGFDGIKIGDVNFSWLTSSSSENCQPNEFSEPGGVRATLGVPTVSLSQDEEVALTVKVSNALDLTSFQFALKVPAEQLEVLEVLTNTLPNYSVEDNFGLNIFDADALSTLWFKNTPGSILLPSNSPLFTVVVKAKSPISNLQELITLHPEVTPDFFFQSTGTQTVQLVPLAITVEPATGNRSDLAAERAQGQSTLRCDPNPFADACTVSINHKGERDETVLSVTDMSGAVVLQQPLLLFEGENTFRLSAFKSLPIGTYVVSVKSNGQLLTTKVIKNQ